MKRRQLFLFTSAPTPPPSFQKKKEDKDKKKKTKTKRDLATWSKSTKGMEAYPQKEWKPESTILGSAEYHVAPQKGSPSTCVYCPTVLQALKHPPHHITRKGLTSTRMATV